MESIRTAIPSRLLQSSASDYTVNKYRGPHAFQALERWKRRPIGGCLGLRRGCWGRGGGGFAGRAASAAAGDGQVREIALESEALRQRRAQRIAHGQVGHLLHAAAAVADEMKMRRIVGAMVAGATLFDVRVADEPHLLEELQRAIDRRSIDRRE